MALSGASLTAFIQEHQLEDTLVHGIIHLNKNTYMKGSELHLPDEFQFTSMYGADVFKAMKFGDQYLVNMGSGSRFFSREEIVESITKDIWMLVFVF